MHPYAKNIADFPKQLSLAGLKASHLEKLNPLKPNEKVNIIGMGGSGLAGGLLQNFASEFNLQTADIRISNDFPSSSAKENFWIFVSFSGNTEETNRGFDKAPAGQKAVITTGGKLKEKAEKQKIPLILFPSEDLVPRQATGYMLYSLLKIFKRLFPKAKFPPPIKINPLDFRSKARKFAKSIGERIPLIYSSAKNQSLAYIWKIFLNETGKKPAFCNFIPEMLHNEIESLSESQASKFIAFLIRDAADSPEIRKRFDAFESFLKKQKVPLNVVKLSGKTQRIWNAVLTADWTSFETAMLRKTEPSKTPTIDIFKRALQN